ncbi:MAG TPA: response regulator [Thermoanaerobaculia bacterium]|jgi:DNA-binding response OmpR family regulator
MGHRVLIVEDDHGIQTLLEAVLRRHSIESSTAGDGDGALKQIGREEFGAILLDLLLPRVNGFDVLRHLKNTRRTMLARTIVITAAAESTLRDCEELDLVRCVLRKPLDIDELVGRVRECLDERAATPAHSEGFEGQRDIRWRSG